MKHYFLSFPSNSLIESKTCFRIFMKIELFSFSLLLFRICFINGDFLELRHEFFWCEVWRKNRRGLKVWVSWHELLQFLNSVTLSNRVEIKSQIWTSPLSYTSSLVKIKKEMIKRATTTLVNPSNLQIWFQHLKVDVIYEKAFFFFKYSINGKFLFFSEKKILSD